MTSNDSIDSSIYSLTIFHRQVCVFHLNVAEAQVTKYWRNFLSKPSTRVECCDLRTSNRKFSPKRYLRQIKLLKGLLFSMKSFCKRLVPNVNTDKEGFNSYTTPMYKLFCFETLSGHKFILMTNPSVYYGNELLRQLYSTIYLDNVIKSPNYVFGTIIENHFFENSLVSFFKNFIQDITVL